MKRRSFERLFLLSDLILMLLVIDNYDSFTYNLVQYLGELGAELLVIKNDQLSLDEIQKTIDPSKLLISPGPGTPDKAGISLKVIEKYCRIIPILGVCLGHQAIGEFFGGKVIKAEAPIHGKSSIIEHDGKTIFKDIPQDLLVGRYHSLVIERNSLPDCLEISASTREGVVMGLRHKDLPIEGVQFHPESILTEYGKKLLSNFLEI